MINATTGKTIKQFWSKHDTNIALFLMLLIFTSYALFIALNLKPGIIPDEITHYIFSKHYSTTLGIPPDVHETFSRGVYIKQNPFLYYWLNGRVINLLRSLRPFISYWKTLVYLRIINVLYALGTVYFSFLLSKEFITQKWWQLLPVFLLTNTIMFVFLAGGVNYDNLANLFCMASLLFLARVFNNRIFLTNSLACMICLALGSLTKYTVLPLAFAEVLAWLFYLIKNKKSFHINRIKHWKVFLLGLLFFLFLVGNLTIYGYNIIVYQSLLPDCEDILTTEQCSIGIFYRRLELEGLEEKLSIRKSIDLGYPGPIKYLITQWIPILVVRLFGVLGHRYYFLIPETITHLLFLFWIILLSFTYWREFNLKNFCFFGIFVLYLLILFFKNYNIELIFGFKHYALQGRYIFPVVGIFFILITKVVLNIPRKHLRLLTVIVLIILYFYSGPLTFILRYSTVFADWFII